MAGIPEVASTSTGYGTGSAASMSQQPTQQTQHIQQQAQQPQQQQQTKNQPNRQARVQQAPSAFNTPAATVESSQNTRTENAQNANPNQIQAQAQSQDNYVVDEHDLDYITKELNDLIGKWNPNLQFDWHDEVGVMSVRLLNKETGEVIKELPPDDMIKSQLKRKIWLGAVIGTFIDKLA